FFPAGCRICEKLLTRASRMPICGQCLASFERVPACACKICGRPLESFGIHPEEGLLCALCHKKKYAFECARSYGVYKDALVRAILLLKFERMEPLGKWFASRLAEVVQAGGETLATD